MSLYVQELHYINANIKSGRTYQTFDDWSRAFKESQSTSTPQDGNQVHSGPFITQPPSEHVMEHYRDLTETLAKLPRLAHVRLGCHVEYDTSRQGPISDYQLESSTGFFEADRYDFEFYGGHLATLLRAAHAAQKPLNTLQDFGITWSVFHNSKGILNLMASSVQTCQHPRAELVLPIELRNQYSQSSPETGTPNRTNS